MRASSEERNLQLRLSMQKGADPQGTAAAAGSTGSVRGWVVMGVCGCGKSTVGRALAKAVGGTFIEGDEYHPRENIDKMRSKIPLTDEDRAPWLAALAEVMAARLSRGDNVILACSALKVAYRDVLGGGRSRVGDGAWISFVHLDVPREELERRLQARSGHFMSAGAGWGKGRGVTTFYTRNARCDIRR